MDTTDIDWAGFIDTHRAEINDMRKPKQKKGKGMTARKYTDTELEAMEAKERDGLLNGNQKRALTAWKKRQLKASEKPAETSEVTADAPTQAERADAALEAVEAALSGAEDPAANAATTTIMHATPAMTVAEPTSRTAIAEALTSVYGAVSALQKLAFQTNDKVVYGFATKMLTGELMDIKANYSKDAK